MRVTSPAFQNNQPLPINCGGRNDNIVPLLNLSDIPAGTQSLALTVFDTDSAGFDFTHWVIWNMPANTTQISANQLSSGAVEGVNDFGKIGWVGPTPPSGTHRYHFVIYALDTTLSIPADAKRNILENAMKNHILSYGEIIGTFAAQN